MCEKNKKKKMNNANKGTKRTIFTKPSLQHIAD